MSSVSRHQVTPHGVIIKSSVAVSSGSSSQLTGLVVILDIQPDKSVGEDKCTLEATVLLVYLLQVSPPPQLLLFWSRLTVVSADLLTPYSSEVQEIETVQIIYGYESGH